MKSTIYKHIVLEMTLFVTDMKNIMCINDLLLIR